MDDPKILDLYPLPIARGYRRLLNASEVKEQHDHAYFLFEIYLKYVTSISISLYLAGEERDHRVNAALKGLIRPSLGEWICFLRECQELLGRIRKSDPVVQAIAALFKKKEASWSEVLRLFNELRSFRTGGFSDRQQVSLEMILGELVTYRNHVLGHGAPLEGNHYKKFGESFSRAFGEVLEKSPFLTVLRLVSFNTIRINEGPQVECAVIEYMGNNPVRRQDPHRIQYGRPLPKEGPLYLLRDDDEFLSLDPLLVSHKEDVYVLNEAREIPEYLSYSTGERYRPSDLGGAQGELFERILSYKIDDTRLSQISSDIAAGAEALAEPMGEKGLRKLGDFRILREIGRGGMGAVFEAVQESLSRRVALKVLPGSFALDSKRLERFHREARATAQIHHPNIVPVYEVGQAEGSHFYAMEYIDGPSLDQVIFDVRVEVKKKDRKGSSQSDPAYITKAVEQVAALADGLEEAHKNGLIHRDVKPSNILLDRSGKYVLVDFGLVREVEAQTLTRSGEMVGTLNYMSPEQVSKNRADARSDVYSLGVTLYELLTLAVPFERETEHEIQRAILFEDPVPPRKLNPRLNRDLETILLHALEKNPERRYQSAGELADDLRRVLRYEPIRARPQSVMTKAFRRAWRHRVKIAVGALILFFTGATFVAWSLWPEKRLILANLRPLTSNPGLDTHPTLTSDHRILAYASDASGEGNLDIWILTGDSTVRRLTVHEKDDKEPTFSPAGETIAFRSDREGGGIYAIPVKGGEKKSIRLIAKDGRRPRFSPDGSLIAYWVGHEGGNELIHGEIFIIPAAGGEPRRLQPHFLSARYPAWSPQGTHLIFLGNGSRDPSMKETQFDWWITPLEGGVAFRTETPEHIRAKGIILNFPCGWLEEKDLVFCSAVRFARRAENLWVVPVSMKSKKVSGPPKQLTIGTSIERYPWFSGNTVVFASMKSNIDLWKLSIQTADPPADKKLELVLPQKPADRRFGSISADGKKLVFISGRSGRDDVWLVDLETGEETQLTSTGQAIWPVISPDGSKVVFRAHSYKQRRSIFQIIETGNKEIREFKTSGAGPWGWSSDGRFFTYSSNIKNKFFMYLFDVDSEKSRMILRRTGYGIYQGHLSPDGRWITFNAVDGAGKSRIFIAPVHEDRETTVEEWIPMPESAAWMDDKPNWSRDGNRLYFLSDRDGYFCIWEQPLKPETKEPEGDPVEFYHFPNTRRSLGNLDVTDLDLSVAVDKIVFNLGDLTGNVWTARLKEQY